MQFTKSFLKTLFQILTISCIFIVGHSRVVKRTTKPRGFFYYDVEVEVFEDKKVTPVEVSFINKNEKIINAEVLGDQSYGGKTLVKFTRDNYVMGMKLISTGACGIFVLQRSSLDFEEALESLKEQKINAKLGNVAALPGAVCIIAGKLENTSPYGDRVDAFCRNLDKKNFLINTCRLATAEEDELYNNSCYASFIYINDKIQLACVRHFIQPNVPMNFKFNPSNS